MKLVLYNDQLRVVEVVEEIVSPQVVDNDATWADGSMTGIKLDFLLLEDGIEVNESVEELMQLDKKKDYQKVDLLKENKELKNRLEATEQALLSLFMA